MERERDRDRNRNTDRHTCMAKRSVEKKKKIGRELLVMASHP